MFTRPCPPTNKGTTSGLNPIANLDALLTTNTYPAKFLLHEITDSSETLLFQRFGIFSNSFGYPFQKEMSVRLNDSFNKNCYHSNGLGDPLEKTVIRSKGSGYPLEKNCHPIERLEISVQNDCQPHYSSVCDEPVKKCKGRTILFLTGGGLENFEMNCLQKL